MPPTDIDGYQKITREIECGGSKLWNSLEEAVHYCNSNQDCKGLHDENCDGRMIYTCGTLNLATMNNGCTYAKKGQLSPGTLCSDSYISQNY